MKIFICVDDNNGIFFNNRRQSKDGVLLEKVLERVGSNRLFIRSYSQKIFPTQDNILIAEDGLNLAEENDFCFVEGQSLLPFAEKITELCLFRWNRSYPFDTTFDLPLQEFTLESTEDFVGSSHEKITLEVYTK